MNKTFVKLFSAFFPSLIANVAYKRMTIPQLKKLRLDQLEVLNNAEKESVLFNDFNIQTYKWQGGQNKVLLIHGWEGQAGNFADLVKRLVKHDYTVFAFDGPSHGFSSKGRTSIFEFTELVGVLIRKFKVVKLVSHSFGGVATTFALFNNLDLKIERYVLLTTPDKFIERIQDVSAQIGITEHVQNKIIKRLEVETSLDIRHVGVSDFVKKINVSQALIIHDIRDKVIPINRSRNVCNHWKVCKMVEVEGTGHFKILKSKSVLDLTIAFLDS